MVSLQQRLIELRNAFIERLHERWSQIELLRDHYRDAPSHEARDEYERAVHNLAGTAGLHGFSELAKASRSLLERIELASEAELAQSGSWPEMQLVHKSVQVLITTACPPSN